MTISRIARGLSLVVVMAACGRSASPPPTRVPSPPSPPLSAGAVPTVTAPVLPESLRVTATDVTKQAVAVFGDSVGVPPDSTTVGPDAAEEPTWDIDVRSYETHARVQHYVGVFSGEARDRIADRLQRGTQYEGMIRAKLGAAGLPEDMYYLALIESGYSPDAYSRAAAVGIWQFMTATAKGVGLRVDWWIDERRHPTRSTTAAARHLAWLKNQFGSLYVAAAAYNGGSGRLSRSIARYADELEGAEGDDVFFVLAEQNYLRSETREYVPQLIAAALVGKDPKRYGLTVNALPPFAYDSVRIGPSTPVAAVARAAEVPVQAVTALNPHILRGITPPKDSVWVNVPVGSAEGVAETIRRIPAAERAPYTRVRTKSGETFAAVASRVGVTSKQLAWYNPSDGRKRGRLPAGTEILVPSADVLRAARDVPDPAIEIYSASAQRHIVRRGDTLTGIARRYRTTVSALKRLNRLRTDAIFAGQSLRVR